MPSSCVVEDCRDRYSHHEFTSFHKFPFKRKDLMQKWLEFVGRDQEWQPSKWSSICSRHFRKEDFSWTTERRMLKKTAVPSVRGCISQYESKKTLQVMSAAVTPQQGATAALTGDKQDDIIDEHTTETESSHLNGPQFNCRLCGMATAAVVTFATNFEIYGTIQKCLPTLNIQQDDQLPKEMCRVCQKRLENFSRFIDKVLETQSELQRKYCTTERNSISNSTVTGGNSRVAAPVTNAERQLKIKQEPLAVRVKQEVAEGFESFLSSDDMDIMGADESFGDPQLPHEEDRPPPIEQKFQFCDFPMLNTQDIINNCDIMEIINLDDPFINIPDDDVNTLGGGDEPEATTMAELQQPSLLPLPLPPPPPTHPQKQQNLPSAHELLQTHLLIEEHNYAYAAEDFKEEWQIKNYYKTEKTEEGYEHDECVADQEEDYAHDENEALAPHADEFKSLCELPAQYTSLINCCDENRSARPIVTSVSAIAESRLQFSMQKLQIPSGVEKSLPLPPQPPPLNSKTHSKKPNIVVLNESIVKSSSPFQLHACSICQLKFFSLESLSQHRQLAHAHQEEPMVSVPSENILTNAANVTEVAAAETPVRNCKIEAGCERESTDDIGTGCRNDPLIEAPSTHVIPTEWHNQPYRHELPKNSNTSMETFSNMLSSSSCSSTSAAKKQINILEMRQTFLRYATPAEHVEHHSEFTVGELDKTIQPNQLANNNNNSTYPNGILENSVATIHSKSTVANEETVFKVPNKPAPTVRQRIRKTNSKFVSKTCIAVSSQQTKTATVTTKQSSPLAVKNVLENYKQLQKCFRQLQRKCKSLQQNAAAIKTPKTPTMLPSSALTKSQIKFQCRTCPQIFPSIYALLRHKQTAPAATAHYIRKPRSHFAATCSGCEKFFRSKLALRNHMRYICPTLSLRCLRQLQIQTFKCRFCRRITFTHWRLYRRHELRCKQKLQQQKQQQRRRQLVKKGQHRQQLQQRTRLPRSQKNTKLPHCSLISQRRKSATKTLHHLCPLCPKSFSSSNSLNQHRITHCSDRLFKCSLCVRIFKRRNGLAQHMNGFHLQLKPYACPICDHRYALKCDMLRCRHSALRSAGGSSSKRAA